MAVRAERLREAHTTSVRRSLSDLKATDFGRNIDIDVLAGLLGAAEDLAEYGAAEGTLNKDELAF